MDDIQVNIRPARVGDFNIITMLSEELGYKSSDTETLNRLDKILKSTDNAIFVATKTNSTVIGWIHVFCTHRVESDSFGEIGGLVVSSQYRKKGIGKKLVLTAQKWLEKNEIKKLRVRSKIERKQAHKFYSKLGFYKEKEQVVLDKNL